MNNAKLLRGVDGVPPLRISELAWFKQKHEEISLENRKFLSNRQGPPP